MTLWEINCAVNFSFSRLPLSWKLLITGFVIILGSGYLAAVFNAALSVGMNPQAIADHYADKSLSTHEATAIAERGFVEEAFSLDVADMNMDEVDHTQMDMSGMDHSAGAGANRHGAISAWPVSNASAHLAYSKVA